MFPQGVKNDMKDNRTTNILFYRVTVNQHKGKKITLLFKIQKLKFYALLKLHANYLLYQCRKKFYTNVERY